MVQHYRGDRKKISVSTPDIPESDYELVSALRRTRGVEQAIQNVLGSFQHLTHEAIRDSLLELTVFADDAIIALNAACILNMRSIVRRAASVINANPYLSDEIKRQAGQYLVPNGPRTDILGLGVVKVRGANSRLRRN